MRSWIDSEKIFNEENCTAFEGYKTGCKIYHDLATASGLFFMHYKLHSISTLIHQSTSNLLQSRNSCFLLSQFQM